jgi:hypothetical protein
MADAAGTNGLEARPLLVGAGLQGEAEDDAAVAADASGRFCDAPEEAAYEIDLSFMGLFREVMRSGSLYVLPVPMLAFGAATLTVSFLPRMISDALAGELCELQPVGHLSKSCEAR